MKTASMKRLPQAEGARLRDRVASLKASVSRLSPAFETELAPPPEIRFGTTVEAELVTLNELYEAVQAVHQEAHSHEVERRVRLEPAMKEAQGYVTAHSQRIAETALREAMALPAASVLALGLQARLIAFEVSDWWDDMDGDPQHALCRMLLDRLMGLAGVPRIRSLDVSADEMRRWITDPSTAPGGNRFREGAAQ